MNIYRGDFLMSFSFIDISIRAISAYFVLFILTRLMGKKQVSELTFFNYIAGITIGALAATMTIDPRISIANGIIGLGWWVGLTILAGYLDLKSSRARKVLDGQPTIIINNGKILEEAMAANRLNINTLQMMLREKDVFSPAEVECAILETDGKLSIMKKMEAKNATKKDVQTPTFQPPFIPMKIIADGVIIEENLQKLNLNRSWLENQLKQAGINSANAVFFAQINEDGTLYIDKNEPNAGTSYKH